MYLLNGSAYCTFSVCIKYLYNLLYLPKCTVNNKAHCAQYPTIHIQMSLNLPNNDMLTSSQCLLTSVYGLQEHKSLSGEVLSQQISPETLPSEKFKRVIDRSG